MCSMHSRSRAPPSGSIENGGPVASLTDRIAVPMARRLQRLLPATLFGRLTLLLLAFVLVSHVLALTVMFELVPPRRHPHPGSRRTQDRRR